MALKSIMLMITALMILVIPGILYNNLNNNGLVVSQSQSLTCSTDSQTPTCQISGNVGCQASSAYCQLSGSSISFLNGNSPFTQLFTGNIFGMFQSLTQGGATHGPFDYNGGGGYVKGTCVVNDVAGKGLTKWAILQCTEVAPDNQNATKSCSQSQLGNTCYQASTWHNWNPARSAIDRSIPFFQIKDNTTYRFECNWQAQVNYTALTGSQGFTWYGCDYQTPKDSAIKATNPIWSLWIAGRNTMGILSNGYSCSVGTCYHVPVFVQLTNWDTDNSKAVFNNNADTQQFWSQTAIDFYNHLNDISAGGGLGSISSPLLGMITFLIGAVLFILGLGLNFVFTGSIFGTGATIGAGVNEQGTRFAQTLGLGLLIWGPLYSEFSIWFTSGMLPYGFDGVFGIISLILTGLMFFGIFWRMLARD